MPETNNPCEPCCEWLFCPKCGSRYSGKAREMLIEEYFKMKDRESECAGRDVIKSPTVSSRTAPESKCPFCKSNKLGFAREFRLGKRGEEEYATECLNCNQVFYLEDHQKPILKKKPKNLNKKIHIKENIAKILNFCEKCYQMTNHSYNRETGDMECLKCKSRKH